MRPQISWSDLAGRRVGLWGFGVEGRVNLAMLRSLGVEPVIVDDRGPDAVEHDPAEADAATEVVLATAAGGLDALLACEVVVKSPGISRYRPEARRLHDAGIPIVGGLGLWFEAAPRDRVLCITGTKGKSTTTAIAGHLLEQWGYRVMIGGNLGTPPYAPEAGTDHDFWIIETSSYQATDMSSSPPVVVVTSLDADHLPWHDDDLATYQRDKLSLCTQPGAAVTVASGASVALRAAADLLGPVVEWVDAEGEPGEAGEPGEDEWIDGLGLLGAHNRTNARLARAALIAMGIPEASDPVALARGATGFAGLESRLQIIGTIDGVDFVDDSLSTNVLPTLAAVDAFSSRRIALLVGGFDRGIAYGPLADGLGRRTEETLVLTLPDNGATILAALEADPSPAVRARASADLRAAVHEAFAWARPDGVVLLSPAAASFGRFADYRERAQVFAAAMREIDAATRSDGADGADRSDGTDDSDGADHSDRSDDSDGPDGPDRSADGPTASP